METFETNRFVELRNEEIRLYEIVKKIKAYNLKPVFSMNGMGFTNKASSSVIHIISF